MTTRAAALTPDRMWQLTLGLLAVHQLEEVVHSTQEWSDRVGGTRSEWLDAVVPGHPPLGNPIADRRLHRRVAGQALVAAALWRATRGSVPATRAVTSLLCLGWSGAFVMHLTVAARTRSAMPGLATSLLPGLPGAALVLRAIWAQREGGRQTSTDRRQPQEES